MIAVIWCLKDTQGNVTTDHWYVCDTLEEAQDKYADVLLGEDVYSASILSNIVASTDYDITPQSQLNLTKPQAWLVTRGDQDWAVRRFEPAASGLPVDAIVTPLYAAAKEQSNG